jgi:hypothetical protein
MQAWNISSVDKSVNQDNLEEITIYGFSPSDVDLCIKSVITTTTLDDIFNPKYDEFKNAGDYHEGYAISIINKDLVYILDVKIFVDVDLYIQLQDKPSVPYTSPRYFNDKEFYMGLPVVTFALWSGMLCTDL